MISDYKNYMEDVNLSVIPLDDHTLYLEMVEDGILETPGLNSWIIFHTNFPDSHKSFPLCLIDELTQSTI